MKMRKSPILMVLAGVLLLPGLALAQRAGGLRLRSGPSPDLPEPKLDLVLPVREAPLVLVPPSMAVRLTPELALESYQRRVQAQAQFLADYSAETTIRAELPGSAQQGEFLLKRHYTAPNTLKFTAVHYSGDGFVKSNVIVRLLQSEVEHVAKGQTAQTAVLPMNYKFAYKGTAELNGQPVLVYEAKPREKRAGLFKGKIYLDAFTGSLRRAEGVIVKSPSFWVKKVEFQQDYADYGGFTFPVHLHTVASTRLIGQAVVDVTTANYAPTSLLDLAYAAAGSAGSSEPPSLNK